MKMNFSYILTAFGLTVSIASNAVAGDRTIDGSGNNYYDPTMGKVGVQLNRQSFADYSDGIQSLAGASRPSPRKITNAMGSLPEPASPIHGPTDFLWVWAQFLDHDITLTELAHPVETANIPVPKGDLWFDPNYTGTQTLPFTRSEFDTTTGSSQINPREQTNIITAWIDASNVYGSDYLRADILRTNDGTGKLLTSPRRMLSYNTQGLPNAGGTGSNLFLSGDIRANEQLALTVMHTLFMREHNRLAKRIGRKYPWMSGDKIYQKTRRIVGAQMQYITFNEFLPVLLGSHAVTPYEGYSALVDANISTEFSTAMFRFGHSAVSSEILRLNRKGRETRHGHLSLRDAFFAPEKLVSEGGLAPILRGLANQTSNPIDLTIQAELRNFLFAGPGSRGMDLASLNIQRGRDHGLPDYNAVRIYYGLVPALSFSDISSDPQVQSVLASVYDSVDDVDVWVGALAEDTYSGMVGELMWHGIKRQFDALRTGDRFWYESYLTDPWEKKWLRPLSRIIRQNTPIVRAGRNGRIGVPKNVFVK